jgi:hypothetical protein
MNYKTAFNHPFRNSEVLAILRIFNGLSLLIYFSVALFPSWSEFFSTKGFVDPASFAFYPKSWVFYFWENDLLKIILFVMSFICALFYTLGIFAKIALLILIPIQIGLHLAVPLIIHEPQQLTNLLMVLLFFMPIENAYALRKGPDLWRPLAFKHERFLLISFLIYLCLYYFFAGVKKLPDHFWLEGRSVGLLASWPFLANDNFINKLSRLSFFSFIFSYLTLVFEIGFLAIAFTRYRRWLIVAGILFHAGVSIALDVGLFFWAMVQWYPLLLISPVLKLPENQDSPVSR